jgi:hypothetical protein
VSPYRLKVSAHSNPTDVAVSHIPNESPQQGFELYQADRATLIDPMTNEMVIDLAKLSASALKHQPSWGNCKFPACRCAWTDGQLIRTESSTPASLTSNEKDVGWSPTVGSHLVTVRGYRRKQAKGHKTLESSVRVAVIDSNAVAPRSLTVARIAARSRPNEALTKAPTKQPTWTPAKSPMVAPTIQPNRAPTKVSTKQQTAAPTMSPTRAPTKQLSTAPSKSPTRAPTKQSSKAPTKSPTRSPTRQPSNPPTKSPTKSPTKQPSEALTKSPTRVPTKQPSKYPTKRPTNTPTKIPTRQPTTPTKWPTKALVWTRGADDAACFVSVDCCTPNCGYNVQKDIIRACSRISNAKEHEGRADVTNGIPTSFL